MKVIFKKSGFLDFAPDEKIALLNDILREKDLYGAKLAENAQKIIKDKGYLSYKVSNSDIRVFEIS